ncbi:glycosyltransferase [Candidatus Woesearchaeota archaeon]|nr:glycosyltransferase [Candidatus Woesearchaeota archaeon]
MISIIIPAHNEENYIEDTIKAIKNQDFKEYEIIVVCDGCTDNTLEKVKQLADKIIVLRSRKGPAVAKNEGAKRANKDILVFLDADTKISSGLLLDIKANINNYAVGTAKIKPSNKIFKHRLMMSLKNNILCRFGVSNGIIFCSRKNFEKVNGFLEKNKGEDGSFIQNLKKEGKFYISKYPVINSTRRFDKKGYISVIFYWIKESFKKKDDPYEVVR